MCTLLYYSRFRMNTQLSINIEYFSQVAGSTTRGDETARQVKNIVGDVSSPCISMWLA